MTRAELLTAGLRNSNYKVWFDETEPPVVLRFYVADPGACERETAITGRIRTSVPIANVLASDPGQQPPVAVLEWKDGIGFDELLRTGKHKEIGEAAASAGLALAGIHAAMSFPQMGFLNGELNVTQQLPGGGTGWAEMVRSFLNGTTGAQLGTDISRKLLEFIERAAESVPDEASYQLVHADYKPWNLLVSHERPRRITAVLDWEFALAGPALMDLGIFLRNRAALPSIYTTSFVDGYRSGGGVLPANWERLVRLHDLLNLCSMLEKPGDPTTVNDIRALVEATVSDLSEG